MKTIFLILLSLLSIGAQTNSTKKLVERSPKSTSAVTTELAYDWKSHTSLDPVALVNVLDTDVLNALENSGYSLGEMLGGSSKEIQTAQLYKNSATYRSFADVISKPIPHNSKTDQLPKVIPPNSGDIPEMVRMTRNFEDKGKRSDKDTKGGYFIRHLSNNSQYPYTVEYDGDEPRHFDARWLNSSYGFFKLIAVVNRMDRVDFVSNTCGEVRFIYRLSYQSPKSSSTLPFFLNVIQQYPKQENCASFAQKWLVRSEQSQNLRAAGDKAPGQFAELLRNGPLKDLSFRQLEVNFQSLRFTSGYMHDFGGQAMYMQRIFAKRNGSLVPIELENTPDVSRIEKNPEMLNQFVQFLKKGDNLQKLDQGTLVIDFDPNFLSKFAVSWSTLSRARTANKPYTRLFQNKKALLQTVDISKLQFIKSHDALVERLNNLTCMGCHQSSGTAGFHMLGFADKKFSHGFNRQELPFSGHTFAESIRRESYVLALADNDKPNVFRPHSNFPVATWSRGTQAAKFESLSLGHMCLLGTDHFSAGASCAAGLVCQKTVSTAGQAVLFGECVKPKQSLAGAVCWQGEITENLNLPTDRGEIPAYNMFAFQDKWKLKGSLDLGSGYRCGLPQGGAPLGRSSRACSLDEENFKKVEFKKGNLPGEICANQGGNGFDLCAATGDSGSCLESRVVRAMLDTCSSSRFCREDYICQKMPEYNKISDAHYGTKKDGKRVNLSMPAQIRGDIVAQAHESHIGFCVPTYFIFNMRVDGHPSPITGLPPGEPRIDRSQPVRGYK